MRWLAIVLVVVAPAAEAAKTDIVELVNGDAVTGEIKELDFGSLSYSTDSMGTVSIDWEDVTGASSNQTLQVEMTDGRKFFGQLVATENERQVVIRTASGDVTRPTGEIVRMTPIDADESFFERLEGSFSMGFQAQKASEVNTSNLAADVSYRARTYLVGVRLNSTVTDQPSEETSADQSLDLNFQAFRHNLWFSDWFVGWERNDELGIAGRVSAGAAWGRYFVQTNNDMFSVTAGAQASRERYTGEEPNDSVYEGRIEVRYLHRRLEPKTSFNFTTQVYPLLRDLSQYRAESALNLNWEFIEDFFLGLGINYSYDSDPPPDAEKADWSVTTSLGYSF